jgi:hypothetical protein
MQGRKYYIKKKAICIDMQIAFFFVFYFWLGMDSHGEKLNLIKFTGF